MHFKRLLDLLLLGFLLELLLLLLLLEHELPDLLLFENYAEAIVVCQTLVDLFVAYP